MKITLWQQFSSNHSGGFTVVGRFDSADKAQTAVTQLETLIQGVFRWYEAHPEVKYLDMYDPPSPPERKLIEKFDIETQWNLGLSPEDVRDSFSIHALGRILLLNIRDTSWNHSHENLAKLVSRFGSTATGKHWVMEDIFIPGLKINLKSHAPDETTGKRVYEEIRTAMDDAKPDGDVLMVHLELPWLYECYVMDHDVQWDGHILTITGFFHLLALNLPAFVSHLKEEGFTDFDMTFTEMSV